jgi:hypothetical protein
MKHPLALVLIFTLFACTIPAQVQTALPNPQPVTQTAPVITATPTEALCAFMEGRQNLEAISSQLVDKLKNATLPLKTARAEAYGENCIAEDGSLVRFAARETDYYITFTVASLQDEAALGALLEQSLAIINQFPVDQTPGPNPGYVGIGFETAADVQNLWFTRQQAGDLLAQGLRGAELYRALKGQP